MELSFFDCYGDDNDLLGFVEYIEDDDDVASAAESRAFWEEQQQLLQSDLSRKSSTENKIRRDTEEIVKRMGSVCKCSKECRSHCVLREAVDRLREIGYNSALCKSKWRRSTDIPSGEHSYIDIVTDPKDTKKNPIRIIIELNFRSEFSMGRANADYNRLVSRLPEVFVGRPERLRGVIKTMCTAAKRCAKENNMHLAPWRKIKYVQSKWLSNCERSAPESLSAVPTVERISGRTARPIASMLTFDLHCAVVQVA